jgi:hypothetical protein
MSVERPVDAVARRAERLVRIYPQTWRARYGEEFVQYLIDDITDRPVSAARAADVLRGGLLARAAQLGLGGDVVDARRQLRVGLALLGLATAVFLAAGVAVWAQLTVGWQWSAPQAPATRAGMVVMSGTMVAFAVVVALALAPLVWAVVEALVRSRDLGVLAWAGVVGVGVAVLVIGGVHFGHAWPGTGGHPWSGRDLVPGGVARFCWAVSLWITSYWAHPGALSAFPAAELAWMIASPAALVAVAVGSVALLRRVELSARVLGFETWMGTAAGAAMAVFLAGAVSWVLSGGPAPDALFRVGTIDAIAVLVMAGALLVVWRTAVRNLALSRRLWAQAPSH